MLLCLAEDEAIVEGSAILHVLTFANSPRMKSLKQSPISPDFCLNYIRQANPSLLTCFFFFNHICCPSFSSTKTAAGLIAFSFQQENMSPAVPVHLAITLSVLIYPPLFLSLSI